MTVRTVVRNTFDKNGKAKPVVGDWTASKPTYEQLLKLNNDLRDELIKLMNVQNENATLKRNLKNAEYERGCIAVRYEDLKRKHETLQKQPTDAMLKRAATHLLKQELEEQKAKDILGKIPMVKDVKTGKWIPKV